MDHWIDKQTENMTPYPDIIEGVASQVRSHQLDGQRMGMHVQLFGAFLIRAAHGPAVFKTMSRLSEIFAYLGLRSPAPAPRSQVAFHLWPDSTEKQSQTNLRKLLHHIRAELPGSILSNLGSLQLQGTVDVADFRAALELVSHSRNGDRPKAEIAALEYAVSLYQGDLLPQCYEEWIIPDREALRHAFIHACERLLDLYAQARRLSDAILLANRLRQADPLREITYRQLMRLHVQNGDRAAALHCYHACANLLGNELGVEPDATTRELYENLLKVEKAVQMPALPVSHPLIGRSSEWEIFQAEWHRTATEGIRLMVLSGEPGIGKTRLAEDGLHWIERQGFPTAQVACYEGGQASSFLPLMTWLRSRPLDGLEKHCRREVARLLPELLSGDEHHPEPITEGWQRQSFLEALTHSLLNTGINALLLDDLQWCDHDTLEWLHFLFRTRPAARLLLVATFRDEEAGAASPVGSLLKRLRQQERLTEITLPRLNAEQTVALAASILRCPISHPDLYQSAEGVPLFIVEMARSGLDGDPKQPPEWKDFSPRVRAALSGRLERLSFSARALAQAAAVLGREFHLPLIAVIAALSEAEAMLALDELWQRRIVRDVGGGQYAFTHGRLRDVALFDLSPVRLQWLHLQAARHLNRGGPDFALAAGHYLAAYEPELAAEAYYQAARHALALFALEDARSLLEQALSLRSSPPPFGWNETSGDILEKTGLMREANEAYGRALVSCRADDWASQARLHRKIIECISRLDFDSARSAYHQGVADLLKAPDKNPIYWTEWLELNLCWFRANYWVASTTEMTRLLTLMEQPLALYGSAIQKIQYRHCAIQLHYITQGLTATAVQVEMARQNVVDAERLESPYETAECLSFLGFVAFLADLYDESERAYTACLSMIQEYGFLSVLERSYAYLSLVYRRCQRPIEVAQTLDALETALQKTQVRPYQLLVSAQRAWLAYLVGDFAVAQELATSAVTGWDAEKTPYPLRWPGWMVLLGISIEVGDFAAARTHAEALLARNQQQLSPNVADALKVALSSPVQTSSPDWLQALAIIKKDGYL